MELDSKLGAIASDTEPEDQTTGPTTEADSDGWDEPPSRDCCSGMALDGGNWSERSGSTARRGAVASDDLETVDDE
jgi:hypothetical protein